MQQTELIKENSSWKGREPLSLKWVVLGLTLSCAGIALVARIDRALPAPPSNPKPTDFNAATAHRFLHNLTSIGPRVAGSYENEVVAVNIILRAVKAVAASASPHNPVEYDLHRASGAFPLTFFDGMNNVYRDVQSLVVRVRGAGGRVARKRSALLLNCHFDTVPDSPGASDDGAGCAVMIEVLRALAVTPHPIRHDAIFLFNGAEENIMQASHAFITTHKWAKFVRAFINIEASGAGGREVLFQAGPHDPWIMEVYAGAVPYPFASSLAQELFESGTVPGDTDFRIFRDFGKLSGVDLAWITNGYVYHTHLDNAARVPPEALQRTGDNVLALTRGLVASESIESALDTTSRQPVFFDVFGLWLACVPCGVAGALAAAALLLLASALHADAVQASKQLYVTKCAWWRAVGSALVAVGCAHAAGLCAAGLVGLALHALGARLAFYSRPWLLAPLYALPTLGAAWWILRVWVRRARCGAVPVRGWWAARLVSDAVMAGWAALLLVCLCKRLASGFLSMQWVLLLALATHAAQLSRSHGFGRLAWWTGGCLLPVLQTCYMALSILQLFVPIMGRAGTPPAPPDVLLGLASSGLSLCVCSWLLPGVAAARGASRLAAAAALAATITIALVVFTPLGFPYTEDRPQRFMIFHTRRTIHSSEGLTHENLYWAPHLDANTPGTVQDYVPEVASARFISSDCELYPYCGAPYYLPVIGLIDRGYTLAAAGPPDAALSVRASTERVNHTTQALHLNLTGPTHIVLIVSPVEGASVTWCSALNGPPLKAAAWNSRPTYFFTLHDARAGSEIYRHADWKVTLHIGHNFAKPKDYWASLSIAGHAMAAKRATEHKELFKRFPEWSAPSGWGVHLHLLNV